MKSASNVTGSGQPRLLDRVRLAVRVRHLAFGTEEAYVQWTRRFILYHNKRHPLDMGKQEVEAFLTHLAVDRHVSASTQNQAFSALLFLYREVLDWELAQILGQEDLELAANQLVELALSRPARDNLSLLAVRGVSSAAH